MKKINLLSLLVLVPIVTFGETQWLTGQYSNNVNISKTLSIKSAETLEVKILGITERNYDFITLKDKDGKQIGRFSGAMNETLSVDGSSVTATLTSDGSVTKSGVSITIEDPSADVVTVPKYTTGAYKNKEQRTYKMDIPEGYCVDNPEPEKYNIKGCKISLQGETEKDYDFVRITDDKDNKLGSYSGLLDTSLSLGSTLKYINITLISDASITKSGVNIIMEKDLVSTVGSLSGVIILLKKPVKDVTVTVTDSNGEEHNLTTDADGKYSLDNLPIGSTTVTVDTSTIPYDPTTYLLDGKTEKTVEIEENENTELYTRYALISS